jgi:PAS domain S-box-containing protein
MSSVRRKRAPAAGAPAADDEVLSSVVQDLADGVVVCDATGVVRQVNPAFARAIGRDPSALAGVALGELVGPPPTEGTLAEALREAISGPWCGELRATDGGGVWEATMAPTAGGIVAVFRDVRARHQADETRVEFLSMVTHDIKGPLTVILGYTELLSDPADPPSPAMLTDTLGRVRESGEQIHALVSNFVEFSRIEAGRHVLNRVPIDVAEVLSRLVQHHAPRAQRKGIELTYDGAPMPEIEGDRPQIERVVVNLLSNAIKYTSRGGRIRVSGRHDGHEVTIAVEDTGPGIAPEDLASIFEKYRRAPASHRVDGVGLGLFIARTLARAHGGDVRVASTPGSGSTFTLVLPAGA